MMEWRARVINCHLLLQRHGKAHKEQGRWGTVTESNPLSSSLPKPATAAPETGPSFRGVFPEPSTQIVGNIHGWILTYTCSI
ncbi:hypothetical protein BHE90_003348 [Fusarium euwallaceae]|uniref:Uncharacterized protein n=1 Tax=Fusarium euwallaceae TaxID=1147111 RepID=A0A430M296_9HYPO|nr:hypothetical protein BHE90_003348 [Fusarium euwallaceae]